ncbi:YkgJ family cysteine cluster protein [Stieleria varia]|uniref:Flagellin N-methylase n=1 Tax=Stieleria varia TaxID=2528005 RepID=A0A5C6ALA8_9BACT|nr:YkgJ family cysteine cluster protein [Stieleria varia]TWU00803.1 Flagellin N-methylase [Stieleria varia]
MNVAAETALPVTDCTGCGVCCLHMGHPTFNLEPDQLQAVVAGKNVDAGQMGQAARADLQRWLEMPVRLRDETLATILSYQPPADGELDGRCTWLDAKTNQCLHHEHRPQVCRDFEVGRSQCLAWRQSYSSLLRP